MNAISNIRSNGKKIKMTLQEKKTLDEIMWHIAPLTWKMRNVFSKLPNVHLTLPWITGRKTVKMIQ